MISVHKSAHLIADHKRLHASRMFTREQLMNLGLRVIEKRAVQHGRQHLQLRVVFLVFFHLAQGQRQHVARLERCGN